MVIDIETYYETKDDEIACDNHSKHNVLFCLDNLNFPRPLRDQHNGIRRYVVDFIRYQLNIVECTAGCNLFCFGGLGEEETGGCATPVEQDVLTFSVNT